MYKPIKQLSLSKSETICTFDSWRQNVTYILTLDPNFAPLLVEGVTWEKKRKENPLRGFTDDGETTPVAQRRTAPQKIAQLELMLQQILNFCPIISRNAIVKQSTSLNSIWLTIRLHFGFQTSGSHLIDFTNIKHEPDERSENLFQRITAFIDDNLWEAESNITQHREKTKKFHRHLKA